jgi:hypothetical protein
MVQMQARAKRRQQDDEAEARLQDAFRIVENLPPTMLPKLVSHILDMITTQLERSQALNGELAPSTAPDSSAATPYETLKAQGGPFAELIELLNKDHLTDEEEDHMRELAHQQAIGLLADWRPAPTDDDVKRMMDKHENGHQNQSELRQTLLILATHKLDPDDHTDEQTLHQADLSLLNIVRAHQFNHEDWLWSWQEAERRLVAQGKMQPEQDLLQDGESSLLQRSALHAEIPPPTDEEFKQWRDDYYRERYG